MGDTIVYLAKQPPTPLLQAGSRSPCHLWCLAGRTSPVSPAEKLSRTISKSFLWCLEQLSHSLTITNMEPSGLFGHVMPLMPWASPSIYLRLVSEYRQSCRRILALCSPAVLGLLPGEQNFVKTKLFIHWIIFIHMLNSCSTDLFKPSN